jgi:hypothetical protein
VTTHSTASRREETWTFYCFQVAWSLDLNGGRKRTLAAWTGIQEQPFGQVERLALPVSFRFDVFLQSPPHPDDR